MEKTDPHLRPTSEIAIHRHDNRDRRLVTRAWPWLCGLAGLLAAFPAACEDGALRANRVVASPTFKAATRSLDDGYSRVVDDIVALTEIPAPPFGERLRAEAFLSRLREAGLGDAAIDAEGNVIGLRPGARTKGRGPYIVVAAHLDTVFPQGVDVKVRREGTRLMAPGVGDDTKSLAVILAYVRALQAAHVQTDADILFVGDVGEEGPGNLRGVRYLFEKGPYAGKIAAFISIDLVDPNLVVDRAVGSKRYHAVFHGPGGHSYASFGIVNPMAAMSRAVVDLYDLKPPSTPKATYSASVTGGGVSVNSIPGEVFMDFDLRSENPAELARLDGQLRSILQGAVAAENSARSTANGGVSVQLSSIGDRPAGATPAGSDIVLATDGAIRALGFIPEHQSDSTDANIPMSLGIPAVTIGSGGAGARAHALDEWIDIEKSSNVRGMAVGLAVLLAMAGSR